jgi:chromosome segregation protein
VKLKKLEIIGFKSFRDKSTLDFSGGISAIVGPNGCGKSNIVDAIRWVMGEQRYKVLRAKKMNDVIFNGSNNAFPVGMTEVSMILEADGQRFPGDYDSYSEIMISRRTFRDGESEYYINKVPCRLLDIREFLMDIGVGARTYSLVEQNHIVHLIEAKPEDRRQFIEEAAGISKYKGRKEAASRKMESTRQNIVRLADIISEVRSQLNSISRQAKKAERYKKLKKDMKEAELSLALQTFFDLDEKQKSLEGAHDAIVYKKTEAETTLRNLEASIETIKAEILENEQSASRFQERLYEIKTEVNVKEHEIEFSKGKIADISLRKQKNITEIESLKRKKENTIEELNALQSKMAGSDERIADIMDSVAKSQEGTEELKETEAALHSKLEESKVEHVDILTEKVRLKNMQAELVKRIDDLKRRSESYTAEMEESTRKLDLASDSLVQLKSALESDMDKSDDFRKKEVVLTDKLQKAKDDLQIIDQRTRKLKEEIGIKSSRLSSLMELQEGYEWCGEGTRSFMKAKKTHSGEILARDCGSSPECFCGLVADYIEVPKEHEVAVEAVLGEKLQYIIVKNQEDGIKAIDYLKNRSLGRGSFVPLQVRNASSNSRHFHQDVREAVRLTDVVRIRKGFEGIADYLLGDVLLIPDLKVGVSLWRRNGFQGTFVTPDGDIITPHGVLTGGSRKNGDSSLLRNKREIAQLEKEIDTMTCLLKEDEGRISKTAFLISQWEEELLELKSSLHRSELSINSNRKDIERFEGEQKWVEQRINVLAFNMENLKEEEVQGMEKIASIDNDIASLDETEKVAGGRIASMHEQWEQSRRKLEEVERGLTEEKILLASLEEKKTANLNTLTRLNHAITDISNNIDSKISESKAYEKDIEVITENIAVEQDCLGHLYSDYDATEVELDKEKDFREEKNGRLKDTELGAGKIKKVLDILTKEINELEMESRKVSLHAETLKEGMYKKYYVDLNALKAGFKRLDESDIEELKNRLERNRKSVENFGEVNLLALSEHEKLKERYDFLISQVADLNSSLDTLQRTISRINRISRKRFSETFTVVNQRFKEVFSRLFQGGRGELRLTDETDMLNAGVDVDIQLPGKKPQNITLLSGGEKSLAAVALIFSILLYRPTPFLVLDEVDAALDDANITLFNQLIKDISANSQIVLVTHNKRTMEVADNLFGVTMEKEGISTTVSVSFN